MRTIILVVASAVALGAATMTTGALGADQFVGRPGLDHRYVYHHGYFDPYYGPVWTYAWWSDCWDGRRWVLGTRRGWTWQACVWPY